MKARANRQVLTLESNKANKAGKCDFSKINASHRSGKSSKMDEPSSSRQPSNSRIRRVCLNANYQEDRHLLKMIKLAKMNYAARIAQLPPPWRGKFTSFSVDEKD